MTIRPIRTARLTLFFASLSLIVSTCVTTTTGGFNVDASEDRALQDYVQLATAYYDANDLAGARRHLANARAIDDRNSSIHNVEALIYQAEGDLELAEQSFQRALSLDRNNSRARNNYAALLFSLDRYHDAFAELQVVTQDVNYGGRAIAFENLGRAAMRIGREEDAQRAFQRALQLNANLYVSSLELAIFAIDARNWRVATQYFQQYLTTVQFYNVPHTPRALLAGIQIGEQTGNLEWVEDYTLILTTLYKDSPEYVIYQRLTNAN